MIIIIAKIIIIIVIMACHDGYHFLKIMATSFDVFVYE